MVTSKLVFLVKVSFPRSSEYSTDIVHQFCTLLHVRLLLYLIIKVKQQVILYRTSIQSLKFCAGGFSLASALFFLLSSTLVAIGLILYNKEEATYKHKTFHEPLENSLPQSDNSIELEPLHIDKQHLLSGNYKENLPEVVVDKKHPQENPSESHHT